MRTTMLLCTMSVTIASVGLAQEPVKAEIGTAFGLTLSIPDNGSALTTFAIPGAGTFIGSPTLYVTFFPSPSVMFEPQLNLNVVSGGGSTAWSTTVIGQLGYLFKPAERGSAYVAGHVGLLAAGNGNSDVSEAAGASLGYRLTVGGGAAVRFEARYRRWFGDLVRDLNEIAFAVGVGGLIR